ncbi:MAG: DNA helicase UvrD [Candidatus Buchananbacteria bacterium CG10_big_fil_rev_8_21_14_0_10_42_9]|uniref:DNA helicase UvrD n=1 Tax=Candidatus Buchananbacteria bacterium CG10_big_fil_rev_8_21_14_0_10_42_9 TaxID=1974526 RepID=A0A2H0W332_9BACT|nr:MAG: DNA helicase UvrD [Candidatus Buchananbacteria bacterium CG10_big_fil_rev_8_21_14_0_10_42_9]
MEIIADLHVHSPYARACSPQLTLDNLNLWAKRKGIQVLGIPDWTHPKWLASVKAQIKDQGNGLYKLKNDPKSVHFLFATEVACIFSQGGKVRRLHILIWAPNLEIVEKINSVLARRGAKLASDGRPILGMSAKDLLTLILEASPDCIMIPAHAWTPWFGVLGSKSGFDSIAECYEDLTDHIFAIETGLSSDPPMNWSVKELDKLTLISNSDAHSPENLGREANVFSFSEQELSYKAIIEAIKNKDKKKFLYTLEFFPEEGMYHLDGHRNCHISMEPQETKRQKNVCPKCKRPLTVGVMHRVDDLASREKIKENNFIPYKSVVPLKEIIAEVVNKNKKTKTVDNLYMNIIEKGENEFNVLLNIPENKLKKIAGEIITRGIMNVRNKKVNLTAGYDGTYGHVATLSDKERKELLKKPEQSSWL